MSGFVVHVVTELKPQIQLLSHPNYNPLNQHSINIRRKRSKTCRKDLNSFWQA